MTSIFISYAHNDDRLFVRRLYEDLTACGFQVWWDRVSMPSRALTFLQEIRDAIDATDRLILVVGPDAIESEYVRAEWQYALHACKVVMPILRIGDYSLVPDGLSKLHCPDFRETRPYDDALAELVRILAEPVLPLGKLHDVPSLPPHFLPRPEEMAPLEETVLADVEGPVVITSARQTTALQGMGGVGKSVLAAAFARACETRRAFTDGVIWLTIGQQPDLASKLRLVGQAFGDAPENYLDVESGQARLQTLLADKVWLLVLDDVWDVAHAEPFVNALGSRCRLLITTRDGGLATALGAQEHRLDVLSDEAAVKLLANWSDLSVEALPSEAHAVAGECGNLPFALALCGAMARDGTPWTDLLDALREADLTFIEKQFPNYPYPDVLKSLKVSVDALARTDPTGAKHYLELAVFPADEAVPEAAVLTLWLHTDGLNERSARKLITTLERKALLQLGGEAPQRRVALHDLQHDYLRAVQGDLTDLHGELLAAYRQKCPDDWPSGPNDGYFFEHLAYHLVEARRVEELHRLLGLETSEQHNAWYEVRDANGDTAGYVADVTRAWRLAEEAYVPTDSTHTGQSIGLQCRYALITASLNSLAKNIPPALIAALVENEVWAPAEGLAYARQASFPWPRVAALAKLVPCLPDLLKGEAIREVMTGAREVVEHLEGWLELSDSYLDRLMILGELGPHLPEPWLQEALTLARQIEQSPWHRANLLVELAPCLSRLLREPVLREALAAAIDAAETNGGEEYLIDVLIGPGSRLPGLLPKEVLAVIRTFDLEFKIEILAKIAPHLPEQLLEEMLTTAGESEYALDLSATVSVLASHLPESLVHKALTIARAFRDVDDRDSALASLIPRLAELGYPEEARAAVREIKHKEYQVKALVELAPYLPVSLRGEVLEEAFAVAQEIEGIWTRSHSLANVASHLPEPLRAEAVREALAAARKIESGERKLLVLAVLAPRLPESLRREEIRNAVTTAAQEIEVQWSPATWLTRLALLFVEVGFPEEAITATLRIENQYDRNYALKDLALELARFGHLEKAQAAIREIESDRRQVWALRELSLWLAQSGRSEEALEVAWEIEHKSSRTNAIAELASHLPEPFRKETLWKALAAVRKIEDANEQSATLAGLAPHLPEPLLEEALSAAQEAESRRDDVLEVVLTGLATRLAELGRLTKALAVARAISMPSYQALALTKVIPYLPRSLQDEVLSEAFGAMYEMRGLGSYLPNVLSELIPQLAELGYAEEALEVWKVSRGVGTIERCQALVRLIPYLTDSLLEEALVAIRATMHSAGWTLALAELAPHLPESLREEVQDELQSVVHKQLTAARESEHLWEFRVEELARLSPHLPKQEREELIQEVLAALRMIKEAEWEVDSDDEWYKRWALVQAFMGVIRFSSETTLREMIAGACKIGDVWFRVKALAELTAHLTELPLTTVVPLWHGMLHLLAGRTRRNLLSDIRTVEPIIAALGGEEAVAETFRAIQDVGRWWP